MQAAISKDRIGAKFSQLRKADSRAFVAYIMAGDPDLETSQDLLRGLPAAGVDIIELGIPFTDPMADGPTIQLAGQRALAAGQTVSRTLDMVREFRQDDQDTPIILMGYYNPIYRFGVDNFLETAVTSGVDGLIIVDLPPEEDDELCLPATRAGVHFIRLATPTTDDRRLPKVLENTSGFVYFVSITGITGAATPDGSIIAPDVARIKAKTELPVCVGFGIKTPVHARAISAIADGVVVGSSIVSRIEAGESIPDILSFVRRLADAAHSTGQEASL